MKKIILSSLLLLASLIGMSQELVSKKGEPMLPDSGDWAIAVDASPFLNYMGNVFSSSGKNSVFKSNADSNLTVIGKYFLSSKRAVRIKVNLGVNSNSEKFNTTKSGQTDPNVTVEDSWKYSKTSINIGLGIEKRRGKTRLQGLYGAEAMLFYTEGIKQKYKYGNSFTKNEIAPASHDFNGNISGDTRVTNSKQGALYGLGVRGFVGFEYFIFSKISLGMEYGLTINLGKQGDGQVVTERWDAINAEKKTETSQIAGKTIFDLNSGLKNGNALIYASFHF